jgi:tetratricopeptide (TPR) repeat protein
LLPVLGFFDVYYFRYSYVADHFVYLACVGLISLAVGMGTAICNHAGQRGRNLGTVAAAIALLILGVSTWRQARVYKNLETLWSDTLTKNPQSLIAQNNLAWLLATLEPTEGGDPVRAVTLAERACKLTDHRVAACLDTLAVAYAAAGRFQDAVATAGKAIDLARSAGQTQLVSEFQSRLQLYRNGKAYRQAVDVTDPSKP